MRTRNRTLYEGQFGPTTKAWTCTKTRPFPPPLSESTSYVLTRQGWDKRLDELIIDEDHGDHKKTNYVFHRKMEGTCLASVGLIHGGPDDWSTEYDDVKVAKSPACGSHQYLSDDGFGSVIPYWLITGDQLSDSVAMSRLHQRVLDPIAQNMETLFESGQTIKSVQGVSRHLSNLKPNWLKAQRAVSSILKGKAPSGSSKKVLSLLGRGLFKQAANYYLLYQFGIKPLVNDMMSMWSSLDRLKADFENFKISRPRVVTIRYKLYGELFYLNTVEPTSGSTAVWYGGSFDGDASMVRYGIRYKERKPKNTNSTLDRMDWLLRRFGASGPVSLAWELLPYSFVIDWFVDVGEILMGIDDFLIGPRFDTLDTWKSRRVRCTTGVRHSAYSPQGAVLVKEDWYQMDYSLYERSPLGRTLPIGLSHRYKSKQALLSAALAIQSLGH